ncbi:hypothetical protein OHS18_42975 [Amycolatopsis sp. NBC_00355]|uniref:hypothetical protein n=1 Tax=Amycolatopsis sp. NBC_00355 TaxID=2975957 RepID=UPI002E2593D1
MPKQVMGAFTHVDPNQIAQQVSKTLDMNSEWTVASVSMSESWSPDGNNYRMTALVVFNVVEPVEPSVH